jgi:hypothetical protein
MLSEEGEVEGNLIEIDTCSKKLNSIDFYGEDIRIYHAVFYKNGVMAFYKDMNKNFSCYSYEEIFNRA